MQFRRQELQNCQSSQHLTFRRNIIRDNIIDVSVKGVACVAHVNTGAAAFVMHEEFCCKLKNSDRRSFWHGYCPLHNTFTLKLCVQRVSSFKMLCTSLSSLCRRLTPMISSSGGTFLSRHNAVIDCTRMEVSLLPLSNFLSANTSLPTVKITIGMDTTIHPKDISSCCSLICCRT